MKNIERDAKRFGCHHLANQIIYLRIVFFLCKGKSSDLDSVCNNIENLFDNFSLEVFVITWPPFLSGVWKRKYVHLKAMLRSNMINVKMTQK